MLESRMGRIDRASSQQRLIDRIRPLFPSSVGPSEDGVGVEMLLPGEPHGLIRIKFEAYEYDLHSPIATVTSYIRSPGKVADSPNQGVATAFTMAATINEASKIAGHPILHKVLANEKSEPLFIRLKEWGMYQYCNALGEPSPFPVTVNKKTFYFATFPSQLVESILDKYTNKEAAKLLSDNYPSPIRLLQHKIAKAMRSVSTKKAFS